MAKMVSNPLTLINLLFRKSPLKELLKGWLNQISVEPTCLRISWVRFQLVDPCHLVEKMLTLERLLYINEPS